MSDIISDYTVVFRCNGDTRREYYIKAKSLAHANLVAQEIIPSSCKFIKAYHDPTWD